MPERECVLITGGAGYIGSHATLEVLNSGYEAVIVDNFVNSSEGSIHAVEGLTGKNIPYYRADLADEVKLRQVFQKHKIDHVMHFAGLKAMGESWVDPLIYYDNNLKSTLTLLQVMKEFHVYNIIFSSSCAVYGSPKYLPFNENHPVGVCTNPYGRTKYFIEEILIDLARAEKEWKVVLLRYFNPVGAHSSAKIGEDPCGVPNNLMPFMAQVAVGRLPEIKIFGSDYDTPDGTGVRDYLHVVDLAKGHVAALKKIDKVNGYKAYNLGCGKGYSVLEMIKAFSKACGKEIPYSLAGRRKGDIDCSYADPSLAEKELEWKAKYDLDDMCADLWKWQSNNPNGFAVQNNNCDA